jgi:hypothetical protein
MICERSIDEKTLHLPGVTEENHKTPYDKRYSGQATPHSYVRSYHLHIKFVTSFLSILGTYYLMATKFYVMFIRM